jgi:hypothetical protein
LVDNWSNDEHYSSLKDKTLYANYNDVCYKYYTNEDKVYREECDNLFSTHEEADNRMFYHLTSVANNSNVIIKTADTDCLLIGLGCKDKFPTLINLWFEVGTQNNVRFISLNQLYRHIGEKLCKALPFYHAFTGCDYTSSFSRRGKVKPLKILENLEVVQDVFVNLSQQQELSKDLSPKLNHSCAKCMAKRS